MRWTLIAKFVLAFVMVANASAQTIETVLGTGKPEINAAVGKALEVNVGEPFGVEIGPDGALYVTEVRNHRIWRVDLKFKAAKVVAGNGQKGYSGDGGPATDAKLNEPYEVRFDRAGNMIFVEMKNHLVRKVDAKTGVISTIAGTGHEGFSGDGELAKIATFRQPHSIAIDAEDNLYIADILNHRIRRVDAKTGIVETVAGNGDKKPPVAGETAKGKSMVGPRALFIERQTLWIALREGHSVWKMDLPTGMLTHIAGTGEKGFAGDGGPAAKGKFDGPKGIVVADNKVFVVDTENQTIRRIDLQTGLLSTVAGQGPKFRGGKGDGAAATSAEMDRPHGIGAGADGAIYIGDTNNHRVRRVK